MRGRTEGLLNEAFSAELGESTGEQNGNVIITTVSHTLPKDLQAARVDIRSRTRIHTQS